MQSGSADQPQLHVPLSRVAVSSVSLGSTDLLYYIEPLPMDQMLYHDVQAVRAWPESAHDELPPLVCRLFFMPHIILVSRLTGGKNASVFIFMDRFHSVRGYFIPASCLFLFLFNIFSCYTVSHICCWGGVSGRWWGEGPALRFSGFFRVASLSGVSSLSGVTFVN